MINQTEGTNKQSDKQGVNCCMMETTFHMGSQFCMNGQLHKCNNGDWEPTGLTCNDKD
jgi:hypothetical protein